MKVADYLSLLAKENIDVVFRALMRTFWVWMEECIQADGGQIAEDSLMSTYDAYTFEIVEARRYPRINAPNAVLPPMRGERVDELATLLNGALRSLPDEEALPFLGELTGAWLLSCPASLIQQYNAAINTNPRSLTTEDDLINIMGQWFVWSLR